MATISASPTQAGTWTIDAAHSLVEFSAKHLMITTVKGRLTDVQGTISLDDARPDRSTVEVEIAAASIHTGVDARDQHLRSADFLDAANFPTITFRGRRVEGNPLEREFRLFGDLTIRGVTREVALDVTYEGRATDPWGNDKVSFSAATKIDRRDFGLTWNNALETGGVLVSNDVKISLEVQAVHAVA